MNRDWGLKIFKLAVFLLMCSVIVAAFKEKHNGQSALRYFLDNFNGQKIHLPLLAVVLMPANWLLETYKWQVLLRTAQSRFFDLLKGVVAGVTMGFVTPGRSGEFIGRVMYVSQISRTSAFYYSLIGGLAQSTVTLAAGVCALAYWSDNVFLYGVVLGISALFLLFYLRIDWLHAALSQIPFLAARRLIIAGEELPDVKTLWRVLFLSLLRYAIYVVQYVLIFQFFGVSDDHVLLAVCSSVLLVAQTFSPLMPLLDVSYRGGMAWMIFKGISANSVAILSAALSVWLINLVLPAILGYWVIYKKGKDDF